MLKKITLMRVYTLTFVSGLVVILSGANTPEGSEPPSTTALGSNIAVGLMVGAAAGQIIAAFGNSIYPKPQLEARSVRIKYDETVKELASHHKEFQDYQKSVAIDIADLRARITEKDTLIQHQATILNALTRRNADLTDRNLSILHRQLVESGKQDEKAVFTRTAFEISDGGPKAIDSTVLLVEDNDFSRNAMMNLLEMWGFRVLSGATLQQGMELLEKNPDVILLDLMLPGGDGIEILKRVRYENLKTKVIVITGKSEQLLGPVMDLHPDAVYHKPVDLLKIIPTFMPGDSP